MDRRGAPARPLAFDELDARDSLPLRLGVSRGGLGIELNQSVQMGPVSVEQFEWSLPALEYPLDLSGGVKQFLHRRGLFERATLRVRPSELGRALSREAFSLWEAPVSCRVRAYADEAIIAVTLHTESVALAFDLVLASAVELRWVIHRARGFGLDRSPLELAAYYLRQVSRHFEGTRGAILDGRSLTLGAWIDTIALELMPGLGARLPEMGHPRLTRMVLDRGDLLLDLEREGEPMPVSGLAVRLAGLADALLSADRALVMGDVDAARREYLQVLEDSPAMPEVLFELAQLDAQARSRDESARLLLERARDRLALRSENSEPSPSEEALYCALEATLALRTKPSERALELWVRAAECEGDGILSGLYYEAAARLLEEDPIRRLELLGRAIERAPQLTAPRWSRVSAVLSVRGRPLSQREFEVALADVAHLHVSAMGSPQKASVLERAARLFADHGYSDRAVEWLRQALLDEPDRESAKVFLGECLLKSGEIARGVDLLRAALRGMEGRRADDNELVFSSFREQDRVRVLLARAVGGEFEEYSEALRLASAVSARSEFSLEARELEWAMASHLDRRTRHRAQDRFLEAVELGYLPNSEDERLRAHALASKMLEAEEKETVPEFTDRLRRSLSTLAS